MSLPQFEYGDEVRVIRNVRNDGTYPGMDTGSLLIRRGSVGCVYEPARSGFPLPQVRTCWPQVTELEEVRWFRLARIPRGRPAAVGRIFRLGSGWPNARSRPASFCGRNGCG